MHHQPFDDGPLADMEERQVIFAMLDSFRWVESMLFTCYPAFQAQNPGTRYLQLPQIQLLTSHAILASAPSSLGVICLALNVYVTGLDTAGCHIHSQYRRHSHYNTTHRRRQNLYALPKNNWQLLAAAPFTLLDTLAAVDDAIDCNADIADAILELGLHMFDLPAEPIKDSNCNWHGTAKPDDLAKAHSTIRQFYRDWSAEGYKAEVQPLLEVVLQHLTDNLAIPRNGMVPPSLLLPGAGLGRLLFSLSLHGYQVEGNEISYHQLLASNFILNSTRSACQYKLYPFANAFTNHKLRSNQLREYLIPDIHPATAMAERNHAMQTDNATSGGMSMTAGDFLTSYGGQDSVGKFDGVITVYFIDTAPNLIRYIETVRNCLSEGGIWINVGPLLWHFDDSAVGSAKGNDMTDQDEVSSTADTLRHQSSDTGIGEPGSFELANDEVLALIRAIGFDIIKEGSISTEHGGYIQDPRSMLQNRYECSHWVARKMPHLSRP